MSMKLTLAGVESREAVWTVGRLIISLGSWTLGGKGQGPPKIKIIYATILPSAGPNLKNKKICFTPSM